MSADNQSCSLDWLSLSGLLPCMYVTVGGIHGCMHFWYDFFGTGLADCHVKYLFYICVPADVQVIYVFSCEPPNAISIICDLTCGVATAHFLSCAGTAPGLLFR